MWVTVHQVESKLYFLAHLCPHRSHPFCSRKSVALTLVETHAPWQPLLSSLAPVPAAVSSEPTPVSAVGSELLYVLGTTAGLKENGPGAHVLTHQAHLVLQSRELAIPGLVASPW